MSLFIIKLCQGSEHHEDAMPQNRALAGPLQATWLPTAAFRASPFQPLVKTHSLWGLMQLGYPILLPFLIDVIY